MKATTLLITLIILGCSKSPEISILGKWIMQETIYDFHSELIITEDGISENYCYYVSNDTIYLDYRFPFKIELLTHEKMLLSKNDDVNYYLYDFYRIVE